MHIFGMVGVAQLVEHRVVVPRVVGSIPTAHPKNHRNLKANLMNYMQYYQDPWNLTFGIVLVIVGFSYLIEAIFGIQIPIFKIILGILLTYWGLKMLTSPIPTIKKKCTYWYRQYVDDED